MLADIGKTIYQMLEGITHPLVYYSKFVYAELRLFLRSNAFIFMLHNLFVLFFFFLNVTFVTWADVCPHGRCQSSSGILNLNIFIEFVHTSLLGYRPLWPGVLRFLEAIKIKRKTLFKLHPIRISTKISINAVKWNLYPSVS